MRDGFFIGLPSAHAVRSAIDIARMSPCAKSQRGAVLFVSRGHRTEIVAYDNNHQPPPFACTKSPACFEHCGMLCLHAEQAALLALGAHEIEAEHDGRDGYGRRDMSMLHIKVVDGQPVAGGPPSCLQCSRLIVDSDIEGIWLYQELHPDVVAAQRAFQREKQRDLLATRNKDAYELEGAHPSPVWVFWCREEFHRETMRNCGATP